MIDLTYIASMQDASLDLHKHMRVTHTCAYVEGILDLDHVTPAEHLTTEHTRSDNSWSTLFDSNYREPYLKLLNFCAPYCICLSFVPCFCLYVHVCHAQVGLLDVNFGGSGNLTTNV